MVGETEVQVSGVHWPASLMKPVSSVSVRDPAAKDEVERDCRRHLKSIPCLHMNLHTLAPVSVYVQVCTTETH